MYDLLLFFATIAAFYGVTLILDFYRFESHPESIEFPVFAATSVLLTLIPFIDMSYFAVLCISVSVLYGGLVTLEEISGRKGISQALLNGVVIATFWPFMLLCLAATSIPILPLFESLWQAVRSGVEAIWRKFWGD